MNKNIWIVNFYYQQPSRIKHARHLMFAKYLQDVGYNTVLFTACEYDGKEGEVVAATKRYVIVKYGEYQYVHIKTSKVRGNVSRGFAIFLFALRLFLLKGRFERPALIIHNIHEPFDYPVYWCAKKMKVKYIADDWDMWAYSFVRQGMVKKNGLLSKFIFCIDRKFFENADSVVFSMEGGKDYIRDMGWDKESGGSIDLNKVHYINNGVDVAASIENSEKYRLEDTDLSDPSTYKAVYMGSVSQSNDLMVFIKAADELRSEKDYRFLIYGNGNQRKSLEKYCMDNQITNVIFKEKHIPLECVPYVLSQCDLNIICHKQGFKYGLSLGKLFQAFASGKPICCNTTNNYDLVKKYNLGVSDDFTDAKECAGAILQLKNLSKEEYDVMCKRVSEIAWQFDYEVLSKKMVKIVKDTLQ